MSYQAIERQLDDAAMDSLVRAVNIPPRPSLLQDLQHEVRKDDPELRRIAQIASKDVAISAAVLKVVNSPLFALSRRAESMEQAASLLGLKQISALITGLVARQALDSAGPSLTRFWDVSTKRSCAVQLLARKLRGVDLDLAQTFGLFCDLGIPLLMRKFPNYVETLQLANSEELHAFTAIEQSRHNTDHALLGAIMARSWGLSQTVAMAIRLHHDYSIFRDNGTPIEIRNLVAYGVLAEYVIQRYDGRNHSVEWHKGGEAALTHLVISNDELEELTDDIHASFDEGI